MAPPREASTFEIEVRAELERARARFAPLNSLHEGYAVILEELDELWDEVRGQDSDLGRFGRAYRELVQIAAMARRTAEDLISHTDRPSVRAMTAAEVDQAAPSQLPAEGDELDLRAQWGDR